MVNSDQKASTILATRVKMCLWTHFQYIARVACVCALLCSGYDRRNAEYVTETRCRFRVASINMNCVLKGQRCGSRSSIAERILFGIRAGLMIFVPKLLAVFINSNLIWKNPLPNYWTSFYPNLCVICNEPLNKSENQICISYSAKAHELIIIHKTIILSRNALGKGKCLSCQLILLFS